MMKSILCIFCCVLLNCSTLEQKANILKQKANILHIDGGHKTASKQDMLLAKFSKLTRTNSEKEQAKLIADTLESNLWYKTAKKIAPSNLTIRQMVLIDVLKGDPDHFSTILTQVKLLSNQTIKDSSNIALWSEGYSYFRYTYVSLEVYLQHFSSTWPEMQELQYVINNIQKAFGTTAYLKDGVYFPAIFGDLRYEPLAIEEIKYAEDKEILSNTLTKTKLGTITTYTSIFKPLGFNTHIPTDTTIIYIISGEVSNFEFYEGYDKKYARPELEIIDILNPKRVQSLKEL